MFMAFICQKVLTPYYSRQIALVSACENLDCKMCSDAYGKVEIQSLYMPSDWMKNSRHSNKLGDGFPLVLILERVNLGPRNVV